MNLISPRVQILSHLEPSNNPRVPKDAEALSLAGFDVEIVTSVLPVPQAIPKRDPLFCRVRLLNQRNRPWALWRHRILQKTSQLWPRAIRPQIQGYGSLFYDLYRHLKTAKEADFTILHLEPALLAGHAAGHLPKAAVDFEDWYSEDLLPGSRTPKLTQVLQDAERAALRSARACWCTSKAMATALAGRYGTSQPLVIRNTFPRRCRQQIDGQWKDRPKMAPWLKRNDPTEERPEDLPVAIHWFSQTIGPGRGLESVFEALAGLEGNWELHLRGGLWKYGPWLEQACPNAVRQRTKIHRLVGPDELPSRIAEHDIGLACEQKTPASRNLTITNKVFQYLQSGLAVVASDTAGQKEAADSAPGAMRLYPAGDVNQLRGILLGLISDRSQLTAMRRAAWEAGEKLCWETEAPLLVEAVREVMAPIGQTRHGAVPR
jgi:glycosyltransferase involved in cell wall biosynthesis